MASEATATPKPAKAILGHAAKNITASLFFIGKEKGYYLEEGLDLELQQVASANATRGMAAGEIDFLAGTGTALAVIVTGLPLNVILFTTFGPIALLYARPDIKSIDELKGKSIAIATPGDFSHNLARTALRIGGLDPQTDVQYISIPGATRNRLQAMVAGAADGAIITPPDNIAADREGLTRLLLLSDKTRIGADGAATTDKLIQERPEVVKGFVKGSLKAAMYFKHNRAGTVPLMAQFTDVDMAIAPAVYDSVVGGFHDEGLLPEEDLKDMLDTQRRVSNVDAPMALTDAFDLSFVRDALQQIKTSGWKPA